MFSCFIPECDTIGSTDYKQPWVPNVIPFENEKPTRCTRYEVFSNLTTTMCTENDFNRSHVIGCNDFVYKTDEISILNSVS